MDGTPWHRDGCFYPIKPLATISAWIAVFDVIRENAGLRFIPGSHKCERLDHFPAGIHPDVRLQLSEVVERTAVDVHLAAGQIVIFDVSTLHGSWPNMNLHDRAGYVARYFPATSRYDRSLVSDLDQSRASPEDIASRWRMMTQS